MQLWLPLALGAAVLWSIGQIFSKKGFSNISPLWNNIIANAFLLVVDIPGALILSHFSLTMPSPLIWLYLCIAGLTYMLFYYVISKGELALTGTLWATYPISTVILSVIFLDERITLMQIIGIISTLIGSLLIALPEKRLPSSISKDKSWIAWGLIGAVIVGGGDFLVKVSSNAIGSYSQIFFLAIIAQLLSIGNFIFDKNGRKLPKISFRKFAPTMFGAFFMICGSFLFYLAFGYGIASLVTPVSSIYPAFTVLLAIVFLKESITKKQAIGILTIVFGVILIGMGV